MCTAWLVLPGAQVVRNVGDMARFGSILFEILAPLQLTWVVFVAAISTASSVALEKDRRTLDLLLMSRLANHELVLGKLLASLLNVLVMLAAGLPIFMLSVLFGGVSFGQIARAFEVTVVASLAAGSLGGAIAFWREKTFQTLAMTALALVIWFGIWEAVATGILGQRIAEISCETWATGFSPWRAIYECARPFTDDDPALGPLRNAVNLYLTIALSVSVLVNAVAIQRVRTWNPSREVRRGTVAREPIGPGTNVCVPNASEEGGARSTKKADGATDVDTPGHRPSVAGESRTVWDNPILWREMCTWAYGRKVVVLHVAYLALFVLGTLALHRSIASGEALSHGSDTGTVVPAAALPLAPLCVVSLVIVNALAVTSITNERDGRSLDLLLVTDVSPYEFIFGKLAGVFWATKPMVFGPIALCLYLWLVGGLVLENILYVIGGLIVMNVFVATLGLHCGMAYSNSRMAIGVSLGTVFFLFMGVVTCILMMVSFSGSFQVQLAPFLAFILGGGVGMYVSLGARNPSGAIGAASLVVPFLTFWAITSFLKQYSLTVFLVTTLAYGFATLAMLVPALSEFDFAMGRTTAAEE
jgi:ABC-type Na+ efflux pump permease subunit